MEPVRLLSRAFAVDGGGADCAVEVAVGASGERTLMTLMILLGAVAALYCLILLFRCATFALPVFAGLGVGLHLHEMGHGWLVAIPAGLTAGAAVLGLGRHLVRSRASVGLRLLVILLFAGVATAAGHQAGMALAMLGDLGPAWSQALAILAGLIAGCRSWQDLVTPVSGTETPVSEI